MIITIEGKPNEGKSRLAEKICKGKKSFLIDEDKLSSSFWNHPMDKDTDIIIVDDVRNFENTYTKFRYEFLTINRRFEEQFKIKMPDIILIKFSLNRYECPQCNIILERESNKKWIKSYCSESGKDVRLQLITKILKS